MGPLQARLVLLCVSVLWSARADEHEHTYNDKEDCFLWMNTVVDRT
ncbi:hypothetical protein FKM82_015125 [Ascaphus truei]